MDIIKKRTVTNLKETFSIFRNLVQNILGMSDKNSYLILATSAGNIKVDRPQPVISDVEVVLFTQRLKPDYAVDALVEGHTVLICDLYSSGLMILNELKKHLNSKYPDESFKGQREFRAAYRELSNRLMIRVSNHSLRAKKSPEIGWLKILYPSFIEYLLPFPQVQGLNSAWQWYEKGIYIPVLGKKIHPWYGTYFPTRFEHLELFENWLKQYRGKKDSAIDVGAGSGVLTFQLLKHGFYKVLATDNNPNAIIGLDEFIEKNQSQSQVKLVHGDLFGNSERKSELIVFNPPWIPASYNTGGLDSAIYYEDDLFTRFFNDACEHLDDGGKVVILFSNIAQITNTGDIHPVRFELESGGRFQKELLVQKQVRPSSNRTKRSQKSRLNELVELWVLKRQ